MEKVIPNPGLGDWARPGGRSGEEGSCANSAEDKAWPRDVGEAETGPSRSSGHTQAGLTLSGPAEDCGL